MNGKTILFYALITLVAAYWFIALPFPDQARTGVNIAVFIVAIVGSLTFIVDMYDLIATRGDGLSWQAIALKVGFFMMCTAFAMARIWAMMGQIQDFPDWMLHSPVGSYFTYLMGLGLGGVIYGFSSAGDAQPKLGLGGMAIVLITAGAIAGALLSHFPF